MKTMSQGLPALCFSIIIALLAAGCTNTIPLAPGAENIKVTRTPAPQPPCQLVGHVIARTVSPYSQEASHVNNNEVRAMKNAALTLGANLIVLGESGATPLPNDNQHIHAVVGTAYSCPYGQTT